VGSFDRRGGARVQRGALPARDVVVQSLMHQGMAEPQHPRAERLDEPPVDRGLK
jgi:hypothetical protein